MYGHLNQCDRCDLETLIAAFVEVAKGGWVKFNRVGELLTEVSRARLSMPT